MSFCQGLSLPFIAIQTHIKLLCVFMALPLRVSMMSKSMRRKWGNDIPEVWIEQGRYHSLEAADEMEVIFETKAHRYEQGKTEKNINV